jgi:hypothetical protein
MIRVKGRVLEPATLKLNLDAEIFLLVLIPNASEILRVSRLLKACLKSIGLFWTSVVKEVII